MKNYCLIIVLCFSITTFFSCAKKDSHTCKDGSLRTAAFDISNADSFIYHTHTSNDFDQYDVLRYTGYDTSNGFSHFSINMIAGGLCAYNQAVINSSFYTVNQNTALKDTLAVQEFLFVPDNFFAIPVPYGNGGYQSSSQQFTFKASGGTTDLAIRNTVTIPQQGSWQLDSAYFFSNFRNMSISVEYNKE